MTLVVLLGSRCFTCGFSDVRAIQIDHVNGDGAAERKAARGTMLYKPMLKLFTENPAEFALRYQLLCANCNWIKRSVKGELRKPNLNPQ